MDKDITVVIFKLITVSSPTHCSNNCEHIRIEEAPRESDPFHPGNLLGIVKHYEATCNLFGFTLPWDRRKKYDGYLRCGPCKVAEGDFVAHRNLKRMKKL